MLNLVLTFNSKILTMHSIAENIVDPLAGQSMIREPTYIDLLLAELEHKDSSFVLRHGDRDMSGDQLRRSIFRYARALASLGVQRGRLVALFAPNCPEALAIRYAAHLLGAAAVFLSVPATPERRAELLLQMAPDLLVLFPETVHLLPEDTALPIATVGVELIAAGKRLDEMAAAESDQSLTCDARPEDLAVISSSGGTTGVPKGSCRSFAVYTIKVHVPSSPDRRQLVNGPLAYLSQVLVDITLLGGGSVVLLPHCDAADTLAIIEKERITDLFLVEPQLFELMDHPDVGRRDLSSLQTLTHIGALAPPTLRRRARARLGAVIAHVYGASEMGVVSILAPAEHDLARPHLFTSAGRIRRDVELRFRRADGTLTAEGEIGSIEVRSPAMAEGYRHRPDLESTAFRDGWYCSGDLGVLDSDGYLYILGRTADIHFAGGVMVSPLLVQDTLCQVPSVRYAVVVFNPSIAFWIAAVSPWPGTPVDPEECRAVVAARHPSAMPLIILSLDRIPLTEQGKPDRAAILRLAANR
jgi:acyl-CoA synthetase (AMP-forming)/AMP-acid ligase II